MKTPKILLIATTFSLTCFCLFLYFDYKKNPITYIILSKKFELISYLFFKDIPAIYPRYDWYSIEYQNADFDKDADSHFSKGNNYFSLHDMESIYKTGIPQKLRKIFNNYAKLNPNKSEDLKVVEDAFGIHDPKGRLLNLILGIRTVAVYDEALQKRIKEYIKFFGKKFIITGITQYKKDEQCGKNSFDVDIIFDSNPVESMTIGLKNSGEICFIWDEKLEFSIYEIKEFKNQKRYQNYWLAQ